MNLTTLKQKASTWWASHEQGPAICIAVLLCIAGLQLMLGGSTRTPAPAQDGRVPVLESRVAALEARPIAPVPEQPAPDPMPARPSAPRVALRPTPHAAPAAPTQPAAARPAWGTTDLDREIAAFPQFINPEQDK